MSLSNSSNVSVFFRSEKAEDFCAFLNSNAPGPRLTAQLIDGSQFLDGAQDFQGGEDLALALKLVPAEEP